MASPTVIDVNGMRRPLREDDCAIDANRSPIEPSMPRMSLGPALLKDLKRFMNVEPLPDGSASKVIVGAVPSKMLAAVAVKCAVARVIGLAPVPAITFRL